MPYPRSFWLASLTALSVILLVGCKLQERTQLFRKPEHEKYYKEARKRGEGLIKLKPDLPSDTAGYRYRIQPGDELRIRFLNLPPELGEGVFEVTADEKYTVSFDGFVVVPLIGKRKVLDLTTEEVQQMLVNAYSEYYVNPGIDVHVTNLKVYIFGEGEQGTVILPTERTHLIEALALAGGVPGTVKPNKIKIIRGDLRDPQVIWVDLRDVEILEAEELYMRSGDIIYLEPRNMALFLREVSPYAIVINIATFIPTLLILLRNLGVI